MVGCVIMPHNLFLHSALVQSREIHKGGEERSAERTRSGKPVWWVGGSQHPPVGVFIGSFFESLKAFLQKAPLVWWLGRPKRLAGGSNSTFHRGIHCSHFHLLSNLDALEAEEDGRFFVFFCGLFFVCCFFSKGFIEGMDCSIVVSSFLGGGGVL